MPFPIASALRGLHRINSDYTQHVFDNSPTFLQALSVVPGWVLEVGAVVSYVALNFGFIGLASFSASPLLALVPVALALDVVFTGCEAANNQENNNQVVPFQDGQELAENVFEPQP